jgi:DNA-binding MarR family transcriptional regulator
MMDESSSRNQMKSYEPGVGRLIAGIRQGIYNLVTKKLKQSDLDVGQFFFLHFILCHEGQTQEQIASSLLLDKATISKGVKRLVQLGYVTRKVNVLDKREYLIYPTAKAQKRALEIDAIFSDVHQRLYKNLNKKQAEQLEMLLTKVYKNFEQKQTE